MEVTIQKRVVLTNLLLLCLVVVGIWAVPKLGGIFHAFTAGATASTPTPEETTQVNQEDALARMAAMAGAQAFYAIDTRTGVQAWIDQLCASSTQAGCEADQNVIVPALWSQLEAAQTVTSVQVSAQDKVYEDTAITRGNAPIQIWQLKIQLSAPWPVQASPQTSFIALALVVKENGAWKFERFLTEDELSVYAGKDGQQ